MVEEIAEFKGVTITEKRLMAAALVVFMLLSVLSTYMFYMGNVDTGCIERYNGTCVIQAKPYPEILTDYNWKCIRTGNTTDFCMINNRNQDTNFVTFYEFNNTIYETGVFNKTVPEFFQQIEELNMTEVWEGYRKMITTDSGVRKPA